MHKGRTRRDGRTCHSSAKTTEDHKFVAGIGADAVLTDVWVDDPNYFRITPAVLVGYRYQPATTGFFIEASVGMRQSNAGVTTSVGATF